MASKDFRNKLMSLQGNLLNYAFMLTSNRDTARELLEHTTEIALEQWADAADDAMFKGWAFKVMRSVFASEFSQETTVERVPEIDVRSIHLTDECGVTETRPEGTHLSVDITRAIASFTDGYRRPIEMYFAGYSVAEIASELSLPVAVVRSRVAYCRNRLRVTLSA